MEQVYSWQLETLKDIEDYVDEGQHCGMDVINLWKECQRLKKELSKETIRKEESYRNEDNLLQENKELRRKTFRWFGEEDYWIWQSDGENYLDSLVCPVVISVEDLKELMRGTKEC